MLQFLEKIYQFIINNYSNYSTRKTEKNKNILLYTVVILFVLFLSSFLSKFNETGSYYTHLYTNYITNIKFNSYFNNRSCIPFTGMLSIDIEYESSSIISEKLIHNTLISIKPIVQNLIISTLSKEKFSRVNSKSKLYNNISYIIINGFNKILKEYNISYIKIIDINYRKVRVYQLPSYYINHNRVIDISDIKELYFEDIKFKVGKFNYIASINILYKVTSKNNTKYIFSKKHVLIKRIYDALSNYRSYIGIIELFNNLDSSNRYFITEFISKIVNKVCTEFFDNLKSLPNITQDNIFGTSFLYSVINLYNG